jgi:hypothetical protein
VTTLREGKIEYHFESDWTASKYDEWIFYREHFEKALGGNKAVDFVAHDPQDTLWLVELKDYRAHPRTKSLALAEEVALKVRDTMAGLLAASKWHSQHADLANAQKHIAARRFRIVLHLEQPARNSKMFPRAFELCQLQQKLKQLVRVVDAHPLVVELSNNGTLALPWIVESVP